MTVCTPTCQKGTAFGFSLLFLILGIVLLSAWNSIYSALITTELKLTNTSTSFKIWKDVPIPIYFEIYMFNWTNSKDVTANWKKKPELHQTGPYTFLERHVRVNLTWNDNGTITYQQKRIWTFLPERSNGSLDDKIITLNPIVATVGFFIKDKSWPIQKLVDVFLEEYEPSFTVEKSVNELLFEGFDDPLLSIIKKVNISGLNIPFTKFGWFFDRNNSETYDGTFTMYTGETDIKMLGLLEDWNGESATDYYGTYCNFVNGTSGELWPPYINYQRVSMFVPDTCSSISINYVGIVEEQGVEGRMYVGDASVFDNGTQYPDMGCFSVRETYPSGIRDVSKCKFGAPAFVSYPHFYLADQSFRDRVVGMKPNKEEHQLHILLEPRTGIPLNVKAQLQLNLLLEPIQHVTMFKNVERTFMPMLWFRQSAVVTPDLADQAKLLLTLPAVFQYTGYGILALGIFFLVIVLYVTFKNAWKDTGDTENLIAEGQSQ